MGVPHVSKEDGAVIRQVAYATDARYVPHVLTSLRSVAAHARGVVTRATVLALDVPKRLQSRLMARAGGIKVNWIDVDEAFGSGLPTSRHLTRATYLRLLMPRFIDEPFLYLDADTIACADLSPLLNCDISRGIGAAVENPGTGHQSRLGLSPETPYLNAGVLLINPSAWNSERVSERALKFAQDFPRLIHWADQCAINAVTEGRLMPLPPVFNVQHSFFANWEGRGITPLTFSRGEAIAARTNPTILHFSGSTKPWHLRDAHPLKSAYWKHRKWSRMDRLVAPLSIAAGRARRRVKTNKLIAL